MVREYYGSECVWCGIDDPRVLVLDHRYARGDPRRLGDKKNAAHLAGWIIRNVIEGNEDPSAFRVLCHNCNVLAHRVGQERPVLIGWGKYKSWSLKSLLQRIGLV